VRSNPNHFSQTFLYNKGALNVKMIAHLILFKRKKQKKIAKINTPSFSIHPSIIIAFPSLDCRRRRVVVPSNAQFIG